MISLCPFTYEDISVLQKHGYALSSCDELKTIIDTWNTKRHQNLYFEMFAIRNGTELVGNASLYQRSNSIVSCGLEIYPEYQRQGYATNAYQQLLAAAKQKGYQIAVAQVRADNAASIALNRNLGFEAEDYTYINKKGDQVYYFIKVL